VSRAISELATGATTALFSDWTWRAPT